MLQSCLRKWIFIPRCMACDAVLNDEESGGGFCSACSPALLPWPLPQCSSCGALIAPGKHVLCGTCIVRPFSLSYSRSAFVYGGPIRSAILRWKGKGAYGAGTRELVHLVESVNGAPNDSVDLWMPIPPSRALQRFVSVSCTT